LIRSQIIDGHKKQLKGKNLVIINMNPIIDSMNLITASRNMIKIQMQKFKLMKMMIQWKKKCPDNKFP
jgi:hypothetical protein